MICRSSDIFYRFGNDRILTKNLGQIKVYKNYKNYTINYARYTMLKNHFLWFRLGCMIVIRMSK